MNDIRRQIRQSGSWKHLYVAVAAPRSPRSQMEACSEHRRLRKEKTLEFVPWSPESDR
jgi:hypothetical protein